MKLLKLTILAVIMTAFLPLQANAKPIVLPKAYLYGFIANFSDSIIYVTDIQEIDSVWFDHKSKFLISRSAYTSQLREYFTNKLNMPNRTCIVMFGMNRKDAEKKYAKLMKNYTGKYAGKYDIRHLSESDFRFETINIAPEELNTPIVEKPKKEKKQKKDKKEKTPKK